jgi:hypothetical protein
VVYRVLPDGAVDGSAKGAVPLDLDGVVDLA